MGVAPAVLVCAVFMWIACYGILLCRMCNVHAGCTVLDCTIPQYFTMRHARTHLSLLIAFSFTSGARGCAKGIVTDGSQSTS